MPRFNCSPLAPLALAALLLSACASTPSAPPAVVSPPPTPIAPPPAAVAQSPAPLALSFASLAGWGEEDHLAALNAFRAGCGVAKDQAMVRVCGLARTAPTLDGPAARAFIEANFRIEPVEIGRAHV